MTDFYREFGAGVVADLLRKIQNVFGRGVADNALITKGEDGQFHGLAPVDRKVVGVAFGKFTMVESAAILEPADQVVSVTLLPATITGTNPGQFGHLDGVEIVPAPGVGKVAILIDALLYTKVAGPAYTGGSDPWFSSGGNDLTDPIDKSICVGAAADALVFANGYVHAGGSIAIPTENASINFVCQNGAFTNPGLAGGTLRIDARFRIYTIAP